MKATYTREHYDGKTVSHDPPLRVRILRICDNGAMVALPDGTIAYASCREVKILPPPWKRMLSRIFKTSALHGESPSDAQKPLKF